MIEEANVKAMGRNGRLAVLLPEAFFHLKETQAPTIAFTSVNTMFLGHLRTDANPGTVSAFVRLR